MIYLRYYIPCGTSKNLLIRQFRKYNSAEFSYGMLPGKARKHKIQEQNMLSEDVNLGAVESLRNWWRKVLGTLLKKNKSMTKYTGCYRQLLQWWRLKMSCQFLCMWRWTIKLLVDEIKVNGFVPKVLPEYGWKWQICFTKRDCEDDVERRSFVDTSLVRSCSTSQLTTCFLCIMNHRIYIWSKIIISCTGFPAVSSYTSKSLTKWKHGKSRP